MYVYIDIYIYIYIYTTHTYIYIYIYICGNGLALYRSGPRDPSFSYHRCSRELRRFWISEGLTRAGFDAKGQNSQANDKIPQQFRLTYS